MTYTKTTWVNGVTPAINETNLNHIETGIDEAHTKLDGIENSATADQTGTEIKTAYEAEANTNAYTDTEKTKLAGVEASADVNNISDVNATDLTDAGDSTLHYHAADRARANHTGSQIASTISDFDTEVANNTDVVANTAKTTNATHTGEVTGSGALTVDKTAIGGKSVVTVVSTDYVLIGDTSDGGNLKKGLISDFASAGGDMQTTVYDPTTVGGDAFDMGNMAEAADDKILTTIERNRIAAAYNVTTQTSAYTASASDSLILCNATSGTFTITLPAASGCLGVKFNIKKTDSSANNVIIDGHLSETIEGETTLTISTQGDSYTIQCSGTEWWII